MAGNLPSKWLGLMRWSAQYSDGTQATEFSAMTAENKAFLESVMKEQVIDEAELMTQAIAVLAGTPPVEAYAEAKEDILARCRSVNSPEELLEFKHDVLEDLQERVEDINNARTFVLLHGLGPLLATLKSGEPSLVWRAASVLASLFQNNPPCQDGGLDAGALRDLADLVSGTEAASTATSSSGADTSIFGMAAWDPAQRAKCRLKAFNALSALVRAHPRAEDAFLGVGGEAGRGEGPSGGGGGDGDGDGSAGAQNIDGLSLLHDCLGADDEKLRVKAAFCLRWFCFARPTCVRGLVDRHTVEVLCNLGCGPAGGEGAGVGDALAAGHQQGQDMREKSLEALLQMSESSSSAIEAMKAVEMPARVSTRAASLLQLARGGGEEAEAVNEEVKLLVQLKKRMQQGVLRAEQAEAPEPAPGAGAAPLLLGGGGGPKFTLK